MHDERRPSHGPTPEEKQQELEKAHKRLKKLERQERNQTAPHIPRNMSNNKLPRMGKGRK